MSKIGTFLKFPNSHKWLFVKIAFLVPAVELGLKTIRFQRTFAILKYFSDGEKAEGSLDKQIVGRYSNYMILFNKQFPNVGKCLARSLSLWFLLQKKGIETELQFGMKRLDKGLLAHAWIEHEGIEIRTNTEPIHSYKTFSESILEKLSG